MAASFEEHAKRLSADGPDQALPGMVFMVADDTGAIRYSKCFGSTETGPVTVDSTMWIASCSKLMTTVAVMQCVEKGLIKLDDPIAPLLPEFADPDVLYGFDEATGAPQMGKAKNKMTMRHLLTHTSGLSYDAFHPLLLKYKQSLGEEATSRPGFKLADVVYPLVFEPGEGFTYGVGVDFAGKAVERANGDIRLGEYMRKNIWEPLGMEKSTFSPSEHASVKANLAGMTTRTSTGELKPTPHTNAQNPPVDDAGGAGVFSCAADYIKVLVSILRNDGKLLKPETVAYMFEPQLTDPKVLKYLRDEAAWEGANLGMTAGLAADKKWSFGLGGLVALEDTPGRRSKGTMNWGGYPNLTWWISPARKTCGFMGMQLVPPFDKQVISLFGEFESMAWETFGAAA